MSGSRRSPIRASSRALDVAFANLYFAALRAYDAGSPDTPRAWQPLFADRGDRTIAPIQFAIAGMNAHINRDLPVALVQTFAALGVAPSDDGPQHADFETVNNVLATTEKQVKALYLDNLTRELDMDFHGVDDVVAIWSVTAAREAAWTNSRVLWHLRNIGPVERAYVTTLDRTVGFASRGLLVSTGSPLTSLTRGLSARSTVVGLRHGSPTQTLAVGRSRDLRDPARRQVLLAGQRGGAGRGVRHRPGRPAPRCDRERRRAAATGSRSRRSASSRSRARWWWPATASACTRWCCWRTGWSGPISSVVIDTAMAPAATKKMPGSKADPAAFDRVEAAMKKASAIVFTHEHVDHVGGVAAAPDFAAIAKQVRMTREQYDSPKLERGEFPAGTLAGLTPLSYQGLYTVSPGVVLQQAPGHSPGSQLIYVELTGGQRFLFVGDIAWTKDNIKLETGRPGIATLLMKEDRPAVAAQLHALAQLPPDVHVVVAHDPIALDDDLKAGLYRQGFTD